LQDLVKGFSEEGFVASVQPLSSFREDYGLEADDEDEDDTEGSEDEEGSGSESGSHAESGDDSE
jgi:hypothetical protein